jgi:hypothetical protein
MHKVFEKMRTDNDVNIKRFSQATMKEVRKKLVRAHKAIKEKANRAKRI